VGVPALAAQADARPPHNKTAAIAVVTIAIRHRPVRVSLVPMFRVSLSWQSAFVREIGKGGIDNR
jgi:hypothetical protein